MNVRDGLHKPLINEEMNIGYQGLTSSFVKKEEYGLSVHWSNVVSNIEGNTQEYLIQYSYIQLKEDFFDWLEKFGMVPSTNFNQILKETIYKNR